MTKIELLPEWELRQQLSFCRNSIFVIFLRKAYIYAHPIGRRDSSEKMDFLPWNGGRVKITFIGYPT